MSSHPLPMMPCASRKLSDCSHRDAIYLKLNVEWWYILLNCGSRGSGNNNISSIVSDEKVSNCHVVIDDNGNIASVYRKTHLFDVDLPEKGIKLMESKYVLPGSKIIPPLETPVGNVGLSIVSFHKIF
ncbi:unnamed protein product, partial [Timema podura]|nr:unnamed protein product [Timema podura]